MKFDRRSFLKLLLASAVAEAVDVEQLLWVPKPIITVPAFPTIGGINRATYYVWRNVLETEEIILDKWLVPYEISTIVQ